MPKVIDTRKQRAAALLQRLKRGPSIGMPHEKLSNEQISRYYRMWAESWILDDLVALVPELRGVKWEEVEI